MADYRRLRNPARSPIDGATAALLGSNEINDEDEAEEEDAAMRAWRSAIIRQHTPPPLAAGGGVGVGGGPGPDRGDGVGSHLLYETDSVGSSTGDLPAALRPLRMGAPDDWPVATAGGSPRASLFGGRPAGGNMYHDDDNYNHPPTVYDQYEPKDLLPIPPFDRQAAVYFAIPFLALGRPSAYLRVGDGMQGGGGGGQWLASVAAQ